MIEKLWVDLEHADRSDDFAAAWLSIQSSFIRGCVQAVLVLRDPVRQSFAPVASWPEGSTGEPLAAVLEHTITEAEGMLVELSEVDGVPADMERHYGLAYPVMVDGELYGAVAMEVTAPSGDALRPAMEGLRWGSVWLENRIRRLRGEEDAKTLKRMKAAVDILAAVLAEERFDGAAMAFVTEIANRLECDRVSLGLVKGKHTQVKAISHTAIVGKKMNLMHSIGAAMDEAVMHRGEILFPVPAEAGVLVVRDHEQMARLHGTRAMMTLPLYGHEKYYAAITLERQDDRPFSEDDVAYVKSVVALTGPVLESRHRQDRPIVFGVLEAMKRQAVRLFGPGYMVRKAAVLALAAVVVFFSVAMDEYRLSAEAVLEGSVSRSLVAPIDGYIKTASARAGDVVKKDTVICQLDDRELMLERINLLSKRGQYDRQYKKAMAEHNRAEANIVSAQAGQVQAELNLLDNRLRQIVIRAPFDGILLSGDLSQKHGAAVKRGEELFVMAPLDGYRLILKVDEHGIADVKEGQRGTLVLSSLSREKFPFTVKKITPLSTAEEGKNYFRVEAMLDEMSPRLRPGMEGVGKIEIDRRLMISIWTRGMIDWFRLRLWAWLP
ncbi:MAG TPA: HlyD family efflux transporter periplasmic adaptor subunit [Syntrophales bacterium]|jgi:multidrug resistance efflux pump|nr:HlyD family efflux transporter periplasmic adaptor subunit [Syntrophales bacterium]